MNREDIIRMAQEAGFSEAILELSPTALERFANLVAQLERERIAKKIEQLPFGDTSASFAIYVREA